MILSKIKIIATFSLILIFLAIEQPIQAQSDLPPDAEALFKTWMAGQNEATHNIESVTFAENAIIKLDGPFGTNNVISDSKISIDAAFLEINREVISGSLNDHTFTDLELERHELRQGLPGYFGLLRTTMVMALRTNRIARRLHPISPTTAEILDGTAAWRFDASFDGNQKIDRVTFWFSHSDAELLKMRVVAHQEPQRGSSTSLVYFSKIDGISLPNKIVISGQRTERRRRRQHTVLFEGEMTFSNFKIQYSAN